MFNSARCWSQRLHRFSHHNVYPTLQCQSLNFQEISCPRFHCFHQQQRHFAFMPVEYDSNKPRKRKRMKKLRALKKTPMISTKLKPPEAATKSLSAEYMSNFEKINKSLTLDKLKDYVDILYVDQHLIAVNKLPGILTARAHDNTLDLQNILKSYMYKHRDFRDWKRFLVRSMFDKFHKMEPFVGVLHRLDKCSSGITMYARHEQAAKTMIDLFAAHKVKKVYIVVIKGEPPRKAADLQHYIATTKFPKVRILSTEQFKQMHADKNELDSNHQIKDEKEDEKEAKGIEEAQIVSAKKDGEKLKWKKAALHYRHIQSFVYQRQQYSVLRVHCYTGRQHQVRAQLSAEGMPIVGDRKYGCRLPFVPNKMEDAIALHAWVLEYKCPFSGEKKSIEAPLPDFWSDRFGSQIHIDVYDHFETNS